MRLQLLSLLLLDEQLLLPRFMPLRELLLEAHALLLPLRAHFRAVLLLVLLQPQHRRELGRVRALGSLGDVRGPPEGHLGGGRVRCGEYA